MNNQRNSLEPTHWLTRLQTKWEIESMAQVILILLVFSLAGSSVVILRKAFFGLIGFDHYTPFWVKTIAYILFMFPAYQCLLLVYGALLGQFRFFWNKERKMVVALRRGMAKDRL